MRITVRFSARALAGAHAGLDLEGSAARYREALIEAVRGDFPDAEVEVARDDTAPSIEVVADDETRAREVERSVTDLAWVVKQCAPWSVMAPKG